MADPTPAPDNPQPPSNPLTDAARKNASDDYFDDEHVIWQDRTHYKSFLGRWLLYVVFAVVVLVVYLRFGRPDDSPKLAAFFHWTALLLLILPALWLTGRMLYARWATRFRLTAQRLFIDRGLLTRTTDQLELIRVDDISVRQTLIDRLVGLGTVIVRSTDATDPALYIRGIPEPEKLAEHVRERMRKLRGRGLYVESL
ncbi:MAG: hypothetical protein BIFFINMI_00525 [Phycisphaerae bacterium]|nr:hypothetical protein [Phycisphaerae bacterium]